jgi:putative colanic acid biosynthesis UDP-glucose lipid carrier transferase
MKRKTIAVENDKRSRPLFVGRLFGDIHFSRRVLVDIVAMIDMGLVIVDALLIRYVYAQSYLTDDVSSMPSNWDSYLSVIVLVTATLCVSLQWRAHYNCDAFEDWSWELGGFRLLVTILFAFGFSLFVVFMMKESSQLSRVWVFSWCISSFIILFVSRIFWIQQFRRFAKKGYFRRRVFLLGAGNVLEAARDSVASRCSNAQLVGVSDLGFLDNAESRQSNLLDNALMHAISKGQADRLDEVIIALPGAESDLLDPIIRRLRLLPVDLKVALDFGAFKNKPVELGHIGATNLVCIQKKPIADWHILLKALEDYVLAALSVIIFLPAMVLIAILIKLDSKGPVFFRQRRHGSNHKVIEVLKFRTMTVLEDGDDIKQATRHDKRITRFGKFLRKSSLDELPQLFNVLTGDMSMVGPRPHALAHNNYYSEMLEDYASRHRVKPGITGWAQINGFRGEITDPDLMEQRVRYDLEYIDNWSILFDLKILMLTPLFGFISKRAY